MLDFVVSSMSLLFSRTGVRCLSFLSSCLVSAFFSFVLSHHDDFGRDVISRLFACFIVSSRCSSRSSYCLIVSFHLVILLLCYLLACLLIGLSYRDTNGTI